MTVRSVAFHATGTAVPQGSKRAFVVNGRAVLADVKSAELKKWRTAVGALAAEKHAGAAPLDGPLQVRLQFDIVRPASVKRQYPSVAPDIDKLTRAVLDALTQARVIQDDARIVTLTVDKVYAPQGGVWVSVRELAGAGEKEK